MGNTVCLTSANVKTLKQITGHTISLGPLINKQKDADTQTHSKL